MESTRRVPVWARLVSMWQVRLRNHRLKEFILSLPSAWRALWCYPDLQRLCSSDLATRLQARDPGTSALSRFQRLLDEPLTPALIQAELAQAPSLPG